MANMVERSDKSSPEVPTVPVQPKEESNDELLSSLAIVTSSWIKNWT
jgi:hypothetical protein